LPQKTITVYVRKDDPYSRTLSFDRIPEITDAEALGKGFAIDGKSLLISIQPDKAGHTGQVDEEGGPGGDDLALARSLSGVLLDTEQFIVDWLGTHGYTVEFA
jgi:hypothetical protein